MVFPQSYRYSVPRLLTSLLTLNIKFISSSSTHSNPIHLPSHLYQFTAPQWIQPYFPLDKVPRYKLKLANLPTPIHQIFPLSISCSSGDIFRSFREDNITLLVKRDDCSSGVELGGNKIRKLEFLLADALQKECTKVVTIGGEQSNHCRATASACRMVGVEPHLILRTNRANSVEKLQMKKDKRNGIDAFGYAGNILFDRIVGSNIVLVTPGEYGRFGSRKLINRLCMDLQDECSSEGKGSVYPIPVGGSNGLGTWGYLLAVDELLEQLDGQMVDHIVFACGSGGTATGITLGIALACLQGKLQGKRKPQLHAVGVCDSPEYFYQEVVNIIAQMGLDLSSTSNDALGIDEWVRDHVLVHQGKGLGYATSTPQELEFCAHFAQETGIVLDPVYSGKALFHFASHVLKSDRDSFRNSTILFWHTGGSLGLFDKVEALSSLNSESVVKRFDVYGERED